MPCAALWAIVSAPLMKRVLTIAFQEVGFSLQKVSQSIDRRRLEILEREFLLGCVFAVKHNRRPGLRAEILGEQNRQ